MSAQIWEFLEPPPPRPTPVQACPHLVDQPLSLCPYRHKASIIWNIATCEQFTMKGKKNLIILILDVHTCVFLLDNFDNSIPKDRVDHEVNVTHRHDWPNKNASVPKSLYAKRKDFIYLSKSHKYGSYIFFSKRTSTFG